MELVHVLGTNMSGNSAQQIQLRVDKSCVCPFCHNGIETQPIHYLRPNNEDAHIFLKCKICQSSFIGYSRKSSVPGMSHYEIQSYSKGNKHTREFSRTINELSENFVKIYGEAETAEYDNLYEICGIGYRKSLEFLVKDYIISITEESKHDQVRAMPLGQCIKGYIGNEKIKQISTRAVWIGNDETHYVRKWEDKDLQDLKKLIDITISYIVMEIEAGSYIESMQ